MQRRDPRNCSKVRPRSTEHGFTLVEMMVSLLIFGLLAAAGAALLSFSVRAQAVTTERLDESAAINRLVSALGADLGQAIDRPTRDPAGLVIPAFIGGSGSGASPTLRLVRLGWTNLDDAPRAALQKVEYQVRGGNLERVAYPMLDGAAPLPPAVMVRNVSNVALRYRIDGAWSDQWTGQPGIPLPQAVELQLTRGDGAHYRALFMVGTNYRPKPVTDGSADAG